MLVYIHEYFTITSDLGILFLELVHLIPVVIFIFYMHSIQK